MVDYIKSKEIFNEFQRAAYDHFYDHEKVESPV